MQSLTTETERPKLRKSRPPPKPTTNEHPVNSMIVPAQYNTVPSGIPMNMMQYIPAFNPASNSVHFDTLLSETRTQNSEIRMHLCRLSDKVDLSLQKVNKQFYPIKNSDMLENYCNRNAMTMLLYNFNIVILK